MDPAPFRVRTNTRPAISSNHWRCAGYFGDTRIQNEEIVEEHNDSLRAQSECAAGYKHVAVEVPLGSPQIEYHERSNQWTPRGSVLRCHIDDDSENILTVGIDDQELTLEEFGRMLTTCSGWGMRIEFVPEDELHRRPAHQVRQPAPE